jgi:hypothetical protein
MQLSGYAFPNADLTTLTGNESTSPNQVIGTEMLQLIRTLDDDAIPTDMTRFGLVRIKSWGSCHSYARKLLAMKSFQMV